MPAGLDGTAALLLLLGLAALYVPTYMDLARRIWPTDEQGHGPIILAVSVWLLFGKRHDLASLQPRPDRVLGTTLLVFGLLLYTLGRTQSLLVLEVLSQNVVLTALVLMFLGRRALRIVWFPLFFLLFMVPCPARYWLR